MVRKEEEERLRCDRTSGEGVSREGCVNNRSGEEREVRIVKGKSNTIKKQGNVKVANWDNEKDRETE